MPTKPEKKEKRGRKAVPTIKGKIQKYSEGGTKQYNFIYHFTINQKAVIDNGWELDVIDLCIYHTIEKFIKYIREEKNRKGNEFIVNDKNGEWFFICESKIIKDAPLLPLSSITSVYKRIVKLIKCGLIERNPENTASRLKLIRLGANSELLDYAKYASK